MFEGKGESESIIKVIKKERTKPRKKKQNPRDSAKKRQILTTRYASLTHLQIIRFGDFSDPVTEFRGRFLLKDSRKSCGFEGGKGGKSQ